MLDPGTGRYDDIYRGFRWRIPEVCNIAALTCDRHADGGGRTALIYRAPDGGVECYSFDWMQAQANRFANLLIGLGLPRGARIALLLGQEPAAPVVHLGAWKAGMMTTPMSHLLGPDALAHRLQDSDADLIVTDEAGRAALAGLAEPREALRRLYLTDGEGSFWSALSQASDRFETLATAPDEPAYITYTSGTTGRAKGVVKGHQSILGLAPSLAFAHDFFPRPGDLSWSPADWAWLAGLTNVLFGSWLFGVPVLAWRPRRFDPEEAVAVMAEHGVRNVLLPATAMRMLRQVPGLPRSDLGLRSIVSGGEAVSENLMAWAAEGLGCPVNVVFGQSECNMVLGNNGRVMSVKPGSLGRPMPGHRVAIVDEGGAPARPGTIGEIAIGRPDPLMMLGYWRQPEATAAKFRGDWMLTGDLGQIDADGDFWFHSRSDDLIMSGGHRIGPAEIEEVLMQHPAVALAAAIGVPDAIRGEAIRAFVQLKRGEKGDDALAETLKQRVRNRLAKHETPREIVFVSGLPLTTTGKVQRSALRVAGADGEAEPQKFQTGTGQIHG